MKVIIAPDSFKDSMTALEAAQSIYLGFKSIFPNWEYLTIPISDGGEGLTECLVTKENIKTYSVVGPLGNNVLGQIGINNNTVILEMSSASGIEYVSKQKRNPYKTTSYGTGQLIKKALDHNPQKIIIGIGGSATNDLGLGMMQALGIKFYDENNNELNYFGESIFKVKSININNLDKRLLNTEIIIAADVNNPLCGTNGATYIYGPQKGLKKGELKKFDEAIYNLAKLLNNAFSKDYINYPGSGAAGGMGYSLLTISNARLEKGFSVLAEQLNIKQSLKNSDILITGEGKIDNQTKYGKAPYSIAELFKQINPNGKVYALAGLIGDVDKLESFDEIISINYLNESISESIKNGKKNTLYIAKEIALKIKKGA